jgi:hypothetical protein
VDGVGPAFRCGGKTGETGERGKTGDRLDTATGGDEPGGWLAAAGAGLGGEVFGWVANIVIPITPIAAMSVHKFDFKVISSPYKFVWYPGAIIHS